MSQSKSDDNWVQDAYDDSTSKAFQMTKEEVREMKKFRRRGFKAFADAYYVYLQLEKKEGHPLDYTLKEFCEKKGIKYPLPNGGNPIKRMEKK